MRPLQWRYELVYVGLASDPGLSGGNETVSAGLAVGTVVSSGAIEIVSSGAIASGTIPMSGGILMSWSAAAPSARCSVAASRTSSIPRSAVARR